jgi:hypothetical protein
MASQIARHIILIGVDSVAKRLGDVGRARMAYHDERVRNLKSKRLQVDEAWAFIYAKQKNVATAKTAPDGAGDVWTWIAMDADTKLVASLLRRWSCLTRGHVADSHTSGNNTPETRLPG